MVHELIGECSPPTMNEISSGIKAEELIQQDSMDSISDLKYKVILKKNLSFIWNLIFKIDLKEYNFNIPIPIEDFWNANSHICQKILYIYSMETFIYRVLNASSRNKDVTKISTLRPFAAAISFILYGAEYYSNRPGKFSFKTVVTLYRGLKLTREDIDQYK